MKLSKFLPQLACFSLLTVSSEAQTSPAFSNLYVFGDSLSDDGNLFSFLGIPGAPYWEGRFSNGRVWVEQLATELGLDPSQTENYAVGGSPTSIVAQQQIPLALFFNFNRFPSDALYVYWAGANDLLGLIGGSGNVQAIIANAMAQTGTALTSLANAGAVSILLPNLPDLSRLPRSLELMNPVAIAAIDAAVRDYNQALAMTVAQLEPALGLDIIELDVHSLTGQLLDDPKTYMLKRIDQAVIGRDGRLAKNSKVYMFFDDIHPTAVGHRLIMRAALATLGMEIRGDVNGDDVVNRSDLKALRKSYGPCAPACPADLNADGFVDQQDAKILRGILTDSIEGGGETILLRRHRGLPEPSDPNSSQVQRREPASSIRGPN